MNKLVKYLSIIASVHWIKDKIIKSQKINKKPLFVSKKLAIWILDRDEWKTWKTN
jgi:hypothetical protein